MRDEQLEKSIKYKSEFNPDPNRQALGLDGVETGEISDQEKLRLANILHRGGYLSAEDIDKLGLVVRPANQGRNKSK